MKLLKYIADKPLPKDRKIPRRSASRAILFDKNRLVPMLFVSKLNYHKLPGGGIEKGEDKIQALGREIKEETGCTARISGEVGKIVEYRSEFNLIQTSYCYLGEIITRGEPMLEQSEIDEGFKLVWFSLDKAISQLKKDLPKNYEGKFIQERDLKFLEECQKLITSM